MTMEDLFTQQVSDNFHWVVGVFAGNGATEAIKVANYVPLRTYYPIRFNVKGEPVPMWRSYLFIEFHRRLTNEVCRSSNKFIKVLSMRDEDGVEYPVLVRKNAIDEHMALLLSGKFNERTIRRRFYGIGSIVKVIDGIFVDKKVKLLVDVAPDVPSHIKVAIEINGLRGSIELWKLAL